MTTKFERALEKIESLEYDEQRRLFFALASRGDMKKGMHRDCADLVALCSRVGCDSGTVEALRMIVLMHMRSDVELCMDKNAFSTPRSGMVLRLRTTELALDACEGNESFDPRRCLSLFIQAFCWSKIHAANKGPVNLLSAVSAQENWDSALEIAEREYRKIISMEESDHG